MPNIEDFEFQDTLDSYEDHIRLSINELPSPVKFIIEPIIKYHLKTLVGKLKVPKIAL